MPNRQAPTATNQALDKTTHKAQGKTANRAAHASAQDDADTTAIELPPWFAPTAERFLNQKQALAHAWLFSGASGIGKFEFAQFLAQSLLCEQPAVQGFACGQCPPCQWVTKGHHPDLKYVYPSAMQQRLFPLHSNGESDEQSQVIRVEQIRGLDDWFHASTHRAGFRVVVVYPAHLLHPIAANAILKILEEPLPQTVFLLLSDQAAQLLPTIRSRCQQLNLPRPDTQAALQWLHSQQVDEAKDWLAAHDGAPMLALAAAKQGDSPVPSWLEQLCMGLEQRQQAQIYALLATLQEQPYGSLLTVLQRCVLDIQYSQFGLAVRHYPKLAPILQQLGKRASPHRVLHILNELSQRQRTAQHPFNEALRVHSLVDDLFYAFT